MTAEVQALSLNTDLLTDRNAWSTADCSVDRALGVVGTRTAMLVLREAYYGTRRFQDFASRVGMTDAATARRLSDLVAQGLLTKSPYRLEGGRTRLEYRLTRKGLDLLPALLALMQWGDRWLTDHGGPLELTHPRARHRSTSRSGAHKAQGGSTRNCVRPSPAALGEA